MDTFDTEEMLQRFQERAKAVRKRNMPPVADGRVAFTEQARLDFQDFAMIADSAISLDDGILTIDLRPAICDATVRRIGVSSRAKERETRVAMENISKSEHRTYDDIMNAQREQRADRAREALIEDEDRPSLLDVVTELAEQEDQDHTRREMFQVIEIIEPINVNECPGLTLSDPAKPPDRPVGFSLTHGYLV